MNLKDFFLLDFLKVEDERLFRVRSSRSPLCGRVGLFCSPYLHRSMDHRVIPLVARTLDREVWTLVYPDSSDTRVRVLPRPLTCLLG